MDQKHYLNLSDEQIEERISHLTPFLGLKFKQALIETDDRRKSLFVASSYPMDQEK